MYDIVEQIIMVIAVPIALLFAIGMVRLDNKRKSELESKE